MRIHYAYKPPFDTTARSLCGAGTRRTENVWNVDCLNCQKSDVFILAMDEAKREKHERFLAQTPREFAEPWHQPYGERKIECKSCGGNTFRQGDRTCYGHYDNFHCSNCGNVESRLTETGMSF